MFFDYIFFGMKSYSCFPTNKMSFLSDPHGYIVMLYNLNMVNDLLLTTTHGFTNVLMQFYMSSLSYTIVFVLPRTSTIKVLLETSFMGHPISQTRFIELIWPYITHVISVHIFETYSVRYIFCIRPYIECALVLNIDMSMVSQVY